MSNFKPIDLTFEQVSQAIAYDPETGKFVWKIAPNRRLKAGDPCGALKTISNKGRVYWYISYLGIQTPAARVAWMLQNGSWPDGLVLFADGDPTNMKFNNLKLADYPTTQSINKDGRKIYKMSKTTARHYALKRYYGMTGEEYGQKLAAQKGLCAICGNPETAMVNGVPKVMHVDHDHATGAIRDLLCGMCNGMLGLAKDNPQVLIAAAEYLQRHSASNVVPLKAVTSFEGPIVGVTA